MKEYPGAQVPNKVGPFLPRVNDGSILGRVGDTAQAESSDQQQRSNDIITVVFTADNHLGYTTFGQQPVKREERQQRLRQAFQQATDFAVGQGVDLFVP